MHYFIEIFLILDRKLTIIILSETGSQVMRVRLAAAVNIIFTPNSHFARLSRI